MVFYTFFGASKYMADNQIPHRYFLIQKQNQENQEYYFIVVEYYEEYHLILEKCLM